MNKKTKYAICGGTVFSIASGLYNIIKQSNAKDENPDYKFDWGQFIFALLKGGAAGAAGGYLIGSIKDYCNSKEKPINTDIILFAAINSSKLDKADKRFLRLDQKAKVVTQILKSEFKNKLNCEPYRLGSTERGTALKDQFDIDICLSFKPNSFSSTEEMYFSLEEVLERYIGTNDIIDIRRQKKSIGVFLKVGTKECKIDVLPTKISKKKGNKSSGYLYVNDESLFGRPTYTRTDVKELNSVKLTETQKKIILAFKKWKERYHIPLSSHLLQCLVLDAYQFNRSRIPRRFTLKLVMVAEYIANHIETITIRSIENSNNILTDIPIGDKKEISHACKEIVDDFNYQPNSIVNHLA